MKREVEPIRGNVLHMHYKRILYSNKRFGQVLMFLLYNCLYYSLCSLPSSPSFSFPSSAISFPTYSQFCFPILLSSSDSPFLNISSFFPFFFLLFLSFSPLSTVVFPLSFSCPPACGPTLNCLSRYYAICCQPLVYRNKMTPLRIALMLGGCWVLPMFISFLPIMQGWNNIGIVDVVSMHTKPWDYYPLGFVRHFR